MKNWKGENHFVGIGDHYGKDIFGGILVAGIILALSSIFPAIGTIGIPDVQALSGDAVSQFLIVVVAAAIIEEIFFRGILLSLLDDKLGWNFFISAVLTSVAFALYHYAAYGGNLVAAGGNFITAGIAGMIFAYTRKYFDSLTPAIILHAVLNFVIARELFGLVIG